MDLTHDFEQEEVVSFVLMASNIRVRFLQSHTTETVIG